MQITRGKTNVHRGKERVCVPVCGVCFNGVQDCEFITCTKSKEQLTLSNPKPRCYLQFPLICSEGVSWDTGRTLDSIKAWPTDRLVKV